MVLPGSRSFRELWDRMSPQSRVRAGIKTVRLEDLLATADPERRRHPPMLDDAPAGREAGAAQVKGAVPVRDWRHRALAITDRDAVVHKICTHLRRGREPCLRCPEWEDSHRGRSHSSIGVQHWIPTGLARTSSPPTLQRADADPNRV